MEDYSVDINASKASIKRCIDTIEFIPYSEKVKWERFLKSIRGTDKTTRDYLKKLEDKLSG